VCGLLRHWGQHGLHHEADAAPVEPGSGHNKKARLGKKAAKVGRCRLTVKPVSNPHTGFNAYKYNIMNCFQLLL